MGVEIVGHEHDTLGLGVAPVHQVFDLVRPVGGRAAVRHRHPPPGPQRLAEEEQVRRAPALVSVVGSGRPIWLEWERVPRLGEQLLAHLVHAHQRAPGVVWPGVRLARPPSARRIRRCAWAGSPTACGATASVRSVRGPAAPFGRRACPRPTAPPCGPQAAAGSSGRTPQAERRRPAQLGAPPARRPACGDTPDAGGAGRGWPPGRLRRSASAPARRSRRSPPAPQRWRHRSSRGRAGRCPP